MNLDIVHIQTSDEVNLAGAMFSASKNNSAFLFFHGDGGNFYSPLYLNMGKFFSSHGITFLSANRRGHDIMSNTGNTNISGGYAFESINDFPLDFDAWINYLLKNGYESIVLGGHSGGAVRVTYAQSKVAHPNVKALIPISPGEYNHNELCRLHGDLFHEAFTFAEQAILDGNPHELLSPGIPWGSTWTAQAFVDCFNQDDRYRVSKHALVSEIPTMFVFGARETTPGDSEELPVCGLARHEIQNHIKNGSDHLSLQIIAGANHRYAGKEDNLYMEVLNFINET